MVNRKVGQPPIKLMAVYKIWPLSGYKMGILNIVPSLLEQDHWGYNRFSFIWSLQNKDEPIFRWPTLCASFNHCKCYAFKKSTKFWLFSLQRSDFPCWGMIIPNSSLTYPHWGPQVSSLPFNFLSLSSMTIRTEIKVFEFPLYLENYPSFCHGYTARTFVLSKERVKQG